MSLTFIMKVRDTGKLTFPPSTLKGVTHSEPKGSTTIMAALVQRSFSLAANAGDLSAPITLGKTRTAGQLHPSAGIGWVGAERASAGHFGHTTEPKWYRQGIHSDG